MNTMTATATTEKGPIVWLDMDQQALDDAYDQAVYAPNRDQLGKRRLAASAAALTRLGKPERRPRCLSHQETQCAGRHLRAWRRVA
jgi:arylformamidase